jgi:hypothetical protein
MGQLNPLALTIAVIILLAIAYFSARQPRKGKKPERQGLSRKELVAIMKHRAEDAVATAKKEHQQTLDYSPASVPLVEQILLQLHRRHQASPLDNEELTQESTKWGAYLGEVIKKLHPSEWALDSDAAGPWSLPLVDRASGSELFPVRWCREWIERGPDGSTLFANGKNEDVAGASA